MNAPLCPFCNAQLPPLAAAPMAEKLTCPRCGEPVPATRWAIDPAAASVRAGEPPPPFLASPAGRGAGGEGRTANRKTAFLMIGIMMTMGLVSLSYILWTAELRRSRHPWMPKTDEPIGKRRPLDLAGLGYLPKDAALIAGLHVAEIIDEKTGLLDEPRPDTVEWLLRPITRSTGLSLGDIDHVAAAAVLDGPLPQIVLVVKTRSPYELEKIARNTRAATPPIYQDHALYQATLDPFGEAYVWCVEPRTLVYVIRFDGLKVEQLKGLSATAKPVEEALGATTLSLMKERLATRQYLWAVGQVDKLAMLKVVLPLDKAGLQDMKAFALGIAPAEGLTAHFQMNDVKSLARFKTLLEGVTIDGAKSQKVEATPIEAPDQWVTWQVRGDAAAMREVLNRGKAKK